jgi:hypothetical protein
MFLTSWGVLAQTIVAPNGNDNTGNGTVGNPYASIRKAIEAVPGGGTILVQDDNSGSTITYVETDPLQINKAMTISGLGENVRVTPSRNATNLFVISASNVTIEGLIIDGTNGNLKANNLIALSPFNQSLDNVVIRQNNLINAGSNNPNVVANGILITAGTGGSGASNLTISNNFINNNGVGVQVNASLTGDSKIFENNLSGNLSSKAIRNTSGQPVNASLNWWGSEAYASVTLAKDGNVDVNPWFRSGANLDIRPDIDGFQSLYSPLGIKKLNPNVNVIDEAVQAVASGGTIFMYYTDDINGSDIIYNTLNVNKPITIQGFPNPTFPDTDIPALQSIITDGGSLTIRGRIKVLANPQDNNYSIRLINGDIDASEGRVTVDKSSLLDYSGGSYNGSLSVTPITVNAGESYVAPALGVIIQSGPESLGQVSVTRTTGPNGITTFGPNQEFKSIAVRWAIDVQNQPSTDGRNVRLEWTSEYDNGIDVSDAFIWRKENEASPWELVESNKIGITSSNLRVIDVSSVKQFSAWTVSDVNNPLPVELTAFSASLLEPHVQLNWETASEINSDFFAIERSENALDFRQVGSLKAAGDSDAPLQYSFIDEQAARRFSGTLFYRLRIVDFDGSYEYSDITSIAVTDEGAPMISAFAREGQQSIKIFTRSVEAGDYQLQISDLSGRKLFDQQVQLGNNQEHQLNIGNLPQSVYMIRCVGKQIVLASKFKVE